MVTGTGVGDTVCVCEPTAEPAVRAGVGEDARLGTVGAAKTKKRPSPRVYGAQPPEEGQVGVRKCATNPVGS